MKQPVRIVALLTLSACVHFAYGQEETVSELSRPYAAGQWHVKLKKAEGINRPEYLFNTSYLLANFYAPDSKEIVKDQRFRLNLQYNKLFIQDANNEELEVISPIKKIEFVQQEGNSEVVIFERGFPPVERLSSNNFYQVLVSGKASLLLDTKFEESRDFSYGGSAAATTSIDKVTGYYGATAEKTLKLSRPENLVELFGDKKTEMEEYIKKQKIKVKSRSDLEKTFTYYNSLVKG